MLNGEGYFDWCMLDANPHMGGHFLWSYNDYARGSEEETMYSGVVDVDRRPKFCYYMMQSMRPSRKSLPGLYEGPMVHIASFNDSAAYPSSVHHIMVFSNCDEVRLYRNHHLIGKQTRAERTRLYPFTVEKVEAPFTILMPDITNRAPCMPKDGLTENCRTPHGTHARAPPSS